MNVKPHWLAFRVVAASSRNNLNLGTNQQFAAVLAARLDVRLYFSQNDDVAPCASPKRSWSFRLRACISPDPPYVQGDLQQGETSERKFVPQRRTKAMSSIQNSADVYMASLKGVKVEIPNNPYLTEEGELARPGQKLSPEQIAPSLPPSPKQQPPTSTTMTYTERLKLARAAKSAGTTTTTPPTARATAPAPAVDVSSNAPAAVAPDTRQPATPVVSYAEKLKLAREAKAVSVAGSPPPPPVQTVRATPFPVPSRLRPDAFEDADLEEDDTHAKVR